MVTVWWSAASLIHYSFLNPWKTLTSEKHALQTDEIHWKLQCLQPALVNRKGPIILHNNTRLHITINQHFKSWMNWVMTFCLIHHIPPVLLPTDYHSLKHLGNFFQGKCFHNQQEAENAFLDFVESRSTFFMLQEYTYFLLTKMCWLQWLLFWSIKTCLSLILKI